MYKFSFLVNPISGGGQGKVILNFVPEIMQSMGFEDSEWTAELTSGKRLREQIRDDVWVVTRGDGTQRIEVLYECYDKIEWFDFDELK